MSPEEVRMLASAVTNDCQCAIIKRKYGELWGWECATMKGLETRGYLRFEDAHRCASGNGDFIRRSKITDAGFAALRSTTI